MTELAPWQVRRAKELIERDLSVNVPITTLADACGVSESHFRNAFKAAVGEPVHQWIITCRIEAAKAMMLDPTRSLRDIAFACGFAEQSHFGVMFKKREGMSPDAWRRKKRQEAALARIIAMDAGWARS